MALNVTTASHKVILTQLKFFKIHNIFNNFGSQRKNGEKKLTEIIVIFQKKKNLLQGNILFFPGYRQILI